MAKPVKDKPGRARAPAGSARVKRERKYKPTAKGSRAAPPASDPASGAIIDAEHVRAVWERWHPLLAGIPTDPPRASLEVLLGEAARVALLYGAYWEPTQPKRGPEVPGFRSMAPASILHEHSGYELLELMTAIVKADADASLQAAPPGGSPMDRAHHVLREIKSSLEFVFDDAEHTAADEQLAQVGKQFPRPRSHDVMAVALETYAELAEEHRVALGSLPIFDLALLDEARTLAGALRHRSGEAKLPKQEDSLSIRNQLLALLQDRLGRIRRTARLLFRDHPEIARRFSSDHGRNVRQARRQRQGAGDEPGG